MSELKKCPFCDGVAEIVHWRRGEDLITYTKCLGPCRAAGQEIAHVGSALDEAKGRAASAWNSRPREDRLEGLLRGAKGTIEQLRAVQNGCPLPSYEEAYRLANDEADRTILAINAALEEEGKE